MLMFGGWGENSYRNDTFVLHLDDMRWEEIEMEVAPESRRFFGMVNCNGNVYLYGGRNDDKQFKDLWSLQIRPSSLFVLACQEVAKIMEGEEGRRKISVLPSRIQQLVVHSSSLITPLPKECFIYDSVYV